MSRAALDCADLSVLGKVATCRRSVVLVVKAMGPAKQFSGALLQQHCKDRLSSRCARG